MLAVPNVSEGRDGARIAALAAAAGSAPGVSLLDQHSDPDHHRTVFTLTGAPGSLHEALVRLANVAAREIDLPTHKGAHPKVGALDIAPIVFLDASERGAACAEALTLGERLAHELGLPVFMYGLLTEARVTRAAVRAGGPQALQARIDGGVMRPDFGPLRLHPTAGAVLVAARPPLVAFNVELAPPADLDTARWIAALIREGGEEGLPSLRAIGIELAHRGGVAQVSMNLEDHTACSLTEVVAAISRHARPLRAELVGLAPASAFDGFPDELPVVNRRTIEQTLASRSDLV